MIPKYPKWPSDAQLLSALEASELSLDNPGFCLACGEQADGCEPDARDYTCECCDEPCVFGAAEIALIRPEALEQPRVGHGEEGLE